MQTNKKELDVDVIGNQKEALTKEEEKLISDYIRSHKVKNVKRTSRNKIDA